MSLLQLGFLLVGVLVVLPTMDGLAAPQAPAVLPTRSPSETLEINNDAWLTADCDEFTSTTTDGFRDRRDFTDCDRFRASAQSALDEGAEYHAVVESEQIRGARATVITVEVHRDENSKELQGERYLYDLVIADGHWKIDDDSFIGETEVPEQQTAAKAMNPAEAVTGFLTGWSRRDCGAIQALTTLRYRDYVGINGCDDFDGASRSFVSNYQYFRSAPAGGRVEYSTDGSTATLTVTETYLDFANDTSRSEIAVYSLVSRDGGWLVDTVDDETSR